MLGLIFVGLCWGLTNKFMEQGAKAEGIGPKSFPEWLRKLINPVFLVPFAIN